MGAQPTTESRLPLFGLSLYYGELEMVSGIRRTRRIKTTTTTTTFVMMTVLLIMLSYVSESMKAKVGWASLKVSSFFMSVGVSSAHHPIKYPLYRRSKNILNYHKFFPVFLV